MRFKPVGLTTKAAPGLVGIVRIGITRWAIGATGNRRFTRFAIHILHKTRCLALRFGENFARATAFLLVNVNDQLLKFIVIEFIDLGKETFFSLAMEKACQRYCRYSFGQYIPGKAMRNSGVFGWGV